MALLLGWQWWVTISLLLFFFAIVAGIGYSIWVISERREPPPRDLTTASRGPADEPRVG